MDDLNTLRVIELFAGVGGFHLGFQRANQKIEESFNLKPFKVVMANQWEPSKKAQDAYECYKRNFLHEFQSEDDIINVDIAKIQDEVFIKYNPDLVVGGFPCQDYSVARSLSGEMGIEGKKGVLFWEIARVLNVTKPKYVLLENVDRLLKSPSKQRGRDFGIMLATFRELGYSVEWRVINAADYGHAQRRRRVFIFAFKNNEKHEKSIRDKNLKDLILQDGFFAKYFPTKDIKENRIRQKDDFNKEIWEVSDKFTFGFYNAGIMLNDKFLTVEVIPDGKSPTPLGEKLETIKDKGKEYFEEYYLTPEMEEKFSYLRGPKRIERTAPDGSKYFFSEGGMSPTDELDKPGRTMLTSEGTVNRSSHIIEFNGRKRFLTPVECERLNEFEDNWTSGMSKRMRYFCMGNALVVGLIEIMGKRIAEIEYDIDLNGTKTQEKNEDKKKNSSKEKNEADKYVQLALEIKG